MYIVFINIVYVIVARDIIRCYSDGRVIYWLYLICIKLIDTYRFEMQKSRLKI